MGAMQRPLLPLVLLLGTLTGCRVCGDGAGSSAHRRAGREVVPLQQWHRLPGVVTLNQWHYSVECAVNLLPQSDLLLVLVSNLTTRDVALMMSAATSTTADLAAPWRADGAPLRPLTVVAAPSDAPANPFVRLAAYFWEGTEAAAEWSTQVRSLGLLPQCVLLHWLV
jgi:hypothetical protein